MRLASISRLAIPGQPTTVLQPPVGAVERALSRLAAAGRVLGTRDMRACTTPDPLIAHWYAGILVVAVDNADAWLSLGSDPARAIYYRWGVLIDHADGWYDPGWHPSSAYVGLSRSWRLLIDDALDRPKLPPACITSHT